MTNWKQGDKCLYNCPQLHDFGETWEGTIIAKDDGMWVVACNEKDAKSPAYNGFPESCLFHIKTPEEIERDRVIKLSALKLLKHIGTSYDAADYRLILPALYDAGLLSDPEKRVKPIGFDEFSKAFDMETCLATYNKWIKEGYIQGADN